MSLINERMAQLDSALAPYATKYLDAERIIPEEPLEFEIPFMADIQRVTGLKASHALTRKTQIFFSPKRDCFNTRGTHARSVANDAMDIGMALGLNLSLLEASALGHDIGHTPFGHAGEKALNRILSIEFKHYLQSHRIPTVLEPVNLTMQVLDAIKNHSSGSGFSGVTSDAHKTHESVVIYFVDKTAETIHDIKDLSTAKIIRLEELPEKALERLGITLSELLRDPTKGFRKMRRALLDSIIRNSTGLDREMTKTICMGQNEQDAIVELKSFRYSVFDKAVMQKRDEFAGESVRLLYDHFNAHPLQLRNTEFHKDMHKRLGSLTYGDYLRTNDFDVVFADLFSSMSDKGVKNLCYAIDPTKAEKIFGLLNEINRGMSGGLLGV